MLLALADMRRHTLRFGVVTLLVGALMTLALLGWAYLSAQTTLNTGAIATMNAPVLVYSADANRDLTQSTLSPQLQQQIASIPGVAATGLIATRTVDGQIPQRLAVAPSPNAGSVTIPTRTSVASKIQLIGFQPGLPGTPQTNNGSLPLQNTETATDSPSARIGESISVQADGTVDLQIVGTLQNARLGHPTAFITLAAYDDLRTRSQLPNDTVSAIAVEPVLGVSAADLASTITAKVSDTQALTQHEAVTKSPAVTGGRILGALVCLGATVLSVVAIWRFFDGWTGRQRELFATLRAMGATATSLKHSVTTQACIVAALASLLALLVTWRILRAFSSLWQTSMSSLGAIAVIAAVAGGTLLVLHRVTEQIETYEPSEALTEHPR